MKKYIKNIKYLIIALVVSVFYFSGCDEDDVVVTPPPPFSPGSADFTMYVSIGNTLTAGFQSNALSERDQTHSFPVMLSKQFQRTSFEQPLILNPGIGDPGRLRLLNLPSNIVTEPSVNPLDPASNLNIALQRPYNNLGIPGSILFDMADETDFVAKSLDRENPFFALILRNAAFGSSVINQTRNLQPTFITAWIGNNDVLGYATSGGTSGTNAGLFDPPGTLPTEPEVFAPLYSSMLDSLAASGSDIVVANIPDVATIPFFTTVGPILSGSVPWGVVAFLQQGLPATGIIYVSSTGINLGLPFNVGFADSSAVRNGTVLFTLPGQTYASLLGEPTGKFYTDNGFPALPPGIDTTQAFGFHPQNPFPDALVLDPDEITISKDAVDAFNGIISAEAGSRDIAVVDFNTFLKNLVTTPIPYDGIGIFSTSFIAGGTFSYDGVHPSSRGYGIIANEWIKVINQKLEQMFHW